MAAQNLEVRQEREKLLRRIQQRFAVVRRQVHLCGELFDYIEVANEEQVLQLIDESCEDDSPSLQPYWAHAWESSIGLCETLGRESLQNQDLLDLGCGLGLLGAFVAARGARVLMVDAVPSAMLFARFNSWPWRERCQVRTIDWRTDRLRQRFDLIAGADIVYDKTDWQVLLEFWSYHLKPGGRVVLAEPKRQSGKEFKEWLAGKDWSIQESMIAVTAEDFPVRLFELAPSQFDLFAAHHSINRQLQSEDAESI